MRLDAEALVAHIRAEVSVAGGGVQQLEVTLPEAVGDRLRFSIAPGLVAHRQIAAGEIPPQLEVPAIVEQQVSQVPPGRRTWTLRLDRRFRGECLLSTTVRLPRPEDVNTLVVPELLVVGADRQNGWIAVEATAGQRLDVSAIGADGLPLTRVDPVDLPLSDALDGESSARVVVGLRDLSGGAVATITEERFDRGAIPSAIGDRLSIVSQLSPGGSWLHRAELSLRATGVQGLRVALPIGAELWATQLDGRPIEVRHNADGYLVPLPIQDQADRSRSLVLFYESPAAPLGAEGILDQSPPQVATLDGTGAIVLLELLKSEWTVRYPENILVTRSLGSFQPTRELDDGSLWASIRRAARMPSLEELTVRLGIIGGAMLTAILLALGWRKYRWWFVPLLLVAGLVLLVIVPLFLLSSGLSRPVREASSDMAATSETMWGETASNAESFHDFADAAAAPAEIPPPAAEPRAAPMACRVRKEGEWSSRTVPIRSCRHRRFHKTRSPSSRHSTQTSPVVSRQRPECRRNRREDAGRCCHWRWRWRRRRTAER